ncbi:P63C domain-containing protein [Sneathiella sp.]|uniref:P63C domain-containing protein n=1 Tax=Sneathiella sp. TaxID=1964365 RepID=UPI002FDFECA5
MSKAKTAQTLGGEARAKNLTPSERSEIAKAAAAARWSKLRDPNRIPEADSQGTLNIGDVGLEVYVLDDKRRVISKKAMANALRLQSDGGNAFLRTMSRKGVRSVLSPSLVEKIENPIYFRPLTGDSADGYEAETLIEVCDALIEAKNKEKLHTSQYFLAIQAEIIIRSAAKVGIVALVDEAAGYVDRAKDEYRKLFDGFIRKEFQQWEKEFPDKFFDMIYKMYGLKRQRPDTTKHPQFFGHFIRKYIYYPLANSNGAILEKLDEKNPVVYDNGGRKYKFTQWLTDHVGLPAFRQHLWQVVGIGEASTNKEQFDRGFYRAFPEAIPRKNSDQLDFYDMLK